MTNTAPEWGPAYRYEIDPAGVPPGGWDVLHSLEAAVPGARVKSKATTAVYVSPHGAWLIEGALRGAGIPFRSQSLRGADRVAPWRAEDAPAYRATGEQALADAASRGEARSVERVKPHQTEAIGWALSRPWSAFVHAPGAGKTWAGLGVGLAGSRGVLIAAPATAREEWPDQVAQYTSTTAHVIRPLGERRGGDLNVGQYLGLLRGEVPLWPAQEGVGRVEGPWGWLEPPEGAPQGPGAEAALLRWHRRNPERLLATGSRALPSEELEAVRTQLWREKARALRGKRPIIVVGVESMADHLSELRGLAGQIGTLILDEWHVLSGDERVSFLPRAVGEACLKCGAAADRHCAPDCPGGTFAERLTEASQNPESDVEDRVKRAVAACELSRLPGLERRLALTATPLRKGRPKRLWAPLDLLDPHGFGGKTTFQLRHCEGHRDPEKGYMIADGRSNFEELRARCSFLVHEVPHSVSHAGLPALRWRVHRLPPAAQGKPDAVRQWIKEEGRKGGAALLNAQLAEAATRKRPAAIKKMLETVAGDGKYVALTYLHEDAERLAASAAKALVRAGYHLVGPGAPDGALSPPEGPEKNGAGEDVWFAWGHGGTQDSRSRKALVRDGYAPVDHRAVLVGTGPAFGTSMNGLQYTDVAQILMLPWDPNDLTQWRGRFDRPIEEGRGARGWATLVEVVVAERTVDERVAAVLAEDFGGVESFYGCDEMAGTASALRGQDDVDALVARVVARMAAEED